MAWRLKNRIFFISLAIGLFNTAFAQTQPSSSLWQIEFGFGPSWYHANSAHTQVTSIERDADKVHSVASTPVYKLGAGYHLFNTTFSKRHFLNDLLLELNWYYSKGSINGAVWQYDNAEFNNYSFRTPFTSNRIMLDIKPSLFTFHHLTPYPILGAGMAWTRIAYREAITNPAIPADSFIDLKPATKTQFAYDLGFGLRYPVDHHLSVFMEYLYTNLNNLTPSKRSNSSNSAVTILKAPSFSTYNQSLLFGFNWTF